MGQTTESAVRWTDEQQLALTVRYPAVLVSAAAGSGKTAVLIERIVRLIADGEGRTSLDRLLVLTFTRAAAEEMRTRLFKALRRRLVARPDDDHLRRQMALLPQADVLTYDAFALRVVRRHAHRLGWDPSFRLIDQAEEAPLRAAAVEAALEAAYESKPEDDPFYRLVDWLHATRDDRPLVQAIMILDDFLRSVPDPDRFLASALEAYAVGEDGTLRETVWLAALKEVLLSLADQAEEALGAWAKEACRLGIGRDAERLAADRDRVREARRAIAAAETWPALGAAAEALTDWGRMPNKPKDADAAEEAALSRIREGRTTLRNRLKKRLQRYLPEASEVAAEARAARSALQALIDLYRRYEAFYQALKAEHNVRTFADVARALLDLLDLDGGAVAAELAAQYDEVLIDEYQDTNRLQEALLAALSDRGVRVFMVGDIKQSIYRFRLSEPTLFLRKYESFADIRAVDSAPERSTAAQVRIDLNRNFRSRPEVLDLVNALFRHLMFRAAAEIDYDARAELVYGGGFAGDADGEAAGVDPTPEWAVLDLGAAEADGPPEDEPASRGDQSDGGNGGGHEIESGTAGDREARDRDERDRDEDEAEAAEELMAAELEGRYIAARIRELVAEGRCRYRDIAVLLPTLKGAADVYVRALRSSGIPSVVERRLSLFAAVDVHLIVALLQLIDNGAQDIPWAAVLTAPFVGLSDDDLALIRARRPKAPFHQAVLAMIREAEDEEGGGVPAAGDALDGSGDGPEDPAIRAVRHKLRVFRAQLAEWRRLAGRLSPEALLDRLYADTGYLEYVGALPEGETRRARLIALRDLAAGYAAHALGGLSGFLAQLERLKESGADDLLELVESGVDRVRIMSIHKSKGLEFPVVFLAGLGKALNFEEFKAPLVLHAELGMAVRHMDLEQGVEREAFFKDLMHERLRRERIAEALRLLYVGLTRAKEKLILLSAIRSAPQTLLKKSAEALLRTSVLKADRYVLWLYYGLANAFADDLTAGGPADPHGASADPYGALVERLAALFAHPGTPIEFSFRTSQGRSGKLRAVFETPETILRRSGENAGEKAEDPPTVDRPAGGPATAGDMRAGEPWRTLARRVARFAPLDDDPALWAAIGRPAEAIRAEAEALGRALTWRPPDASRFLPAKLSVTELKRRLEMPDPAARPLITGHRLERPAFAGDRSIPPQAAGAAMHRVLMRIDDWAAEPSEEKIAALVRALVRQEALMPEEAAQVDIPAIVRFQRSPLGARLGRARRIFREVPFTYTIPASLLMQAPPASSLQASLAGGRRRFADPADDPAHGLVRPEGDTAPIIVQGMIDVVFEEADGRFVILDYKTDRPRGESEATLKERHALQLWLYAKALEDIWRIEVAERWVVYLAQDRQLMI
ncbi:MAG: UvrD-helicase domain-containing protein [Hydrogenibacillus sp.]|nr:UvrD-helicase domain-containing protein [Hydrogenibacillus sp.]